MIGFSTRKQMDVRLEKLSFFQTGQIFDVLEKIVLLRNAHRTSSDVRYKLTREYNKSRKDLLYLQKNESDMKKLVLLFAVFFAFSACAQTKTETATEETATVVEPTEMNLEMFSE